MPTGDTLPDLALVMDRLLAPDGCAWDREQTLASLRPFLLEETYEVLEALDEDDAAHHREELGDLLFQIVFQAAIRQRAGQFDLDDVVRDIAAKLRRRHPHVFTDGAPKLDNAKDVLKQWDQLKEKEKPKRKTLEGIPAALPALAYASKLSERAAGVGFDWPDVAGSRAKVTEELGEVDAAITRGDARAVEEELGDLLFAVVNLARKVGVDVHARGNELTIVGDDDPVGLARRLLEQLYGFARRGQPLGSDDVVRAIQILRADRTVELKAIFSDTVLVSGRARPITPKGVAQKRYVEAIRALDMVFGIGPAGTGKTYLAMAMAVRALVDKSVKRIVLARPAVEAGEKLGFLPGSMEEKVSPYLRPLVDALHDMMDIEKASALVERGVIEVAPLAFMRGRTLNDSFVILDEAQNTTPEQMKMFLTRLGFGSKAVVTGDVTQIDLPGGQASGLAEARRILADVEGIQFCTFTEVDVVRHPLVQRIVRAWEEKAPPKPRPGGGR